VEIYIYKQMKKEHLFSVISVLMLPFFFIGGLNYYASPVYKELWNIGHVIFFTLTSFLLLLVLVKKSIKVKVLSVLVFCLSIGAVIELVQLKIGRNFSLSDVYFDVLGGLLVLCFSSEITKKYRRLCIAFVLFLIILAQSALFRAVLMEIEMRQQFPILAVFNEEKSIERWRGNGIYLDKVHKCTGQYVLAAKLIKDKRFTGFSFEYFPGNWLGYQQLSIVLFNPYSSDLLLNIKITDEDHDSKNQQYNNRFNHQLNILPGWNNVALPLTDIARGPKNRKMSLDKISRIGFFMTNLKDDKTLYIESLKLE
jgi:VanZ family protein